MSHDLEIREIDGTAAYVSSKGVNPWHGLGVEFPEPGMTREQVFASVDEFATPVELVAEQIDLGKKLIVPTGGFATVRRDDLSKVRKAEDGSDLPPKVLGKGFSSQYALVQAADAFEFTDELIENGEASWESAGLLADGRQMFGVLRLPKTIEIANQPDETHEAFILLCNSFDGSLALSWRTTPVRSVCRNTVNLAIARSFGVYTVKHNGDTAAKLAEAREALGISFRYLEGLEAELNRLIDTPISDAEFDDFLDNLVPGRERKALNVKSVVRDIYRVEEDLEAVKGTRYGALQAVAEYVDHRSAVRADTAESRFRRSALDASKSLVPKAAQLLAVAA